MANVSLIVLILLISLNKLLSYPINVWIEGFSTAPQANHHFAIGYRKRSNSILMIGGDNSRRQVLSYYIDNDTFTIEADISRDQYSDGQQYTQINNLLYMTDVMGHYTENVFNVYDLNNKQYIYNYHNTTIPNEGIYEYSCLSDINGIYLILSGGVNNGNIFIKHVVIYSIINNVWLPMDDIPKLNQKRSGHACITYGNYHYVFGGKTSHLPDYTNTVEKLFIADLDNINETNWMTLNDALFYSKSDMRVAIYEDNIYMVGGLSGRAVHHIDVDILDTNTDNITIFNQLVFPTHSSGVIVVNHILYSFLGSHVGDKWQFDVLCNESCPTVSPTIQPTNEPTIYPTVNPTIHPTFNPTIYPTQTTYNPTEQPTATEIPTTNPTKIPTVNPTIYPTFTPTHQPTNYPRGKGKRKGKGKGKAKGKGKGKGGGKGGKGKGGKLFSFASLFAAGSNDEYDIDGNGTESVQYEISFDNGQLWVLVVFIFLVAFTIGNCVWFLC